MSARRTSSSSRTTGAAWPQAVAVLIGVFFAIIGIVGFAATGFGRLADPNTPDRLFGLAVNPLQNLVHLAIGVAGISMSARLPRARAFGWVLLVGFGALFVYGALAARYPQLDVLNLNWPANWMHLAFALVGLVIATGPLPASRDAERTTSASGT